MATRTGTDVRNILQVKISSPDEVIFDAPAKSVSSENAKGSFDVLPGHANFITIVVDAHVTIVGLENEVHEFHFDRCAFYTYHNKVTIYTEV